MAYSEAVPLAIYEKPSTPDTKCHYGQIWNRDDRRRLCPTIKFEHFWEQNNTSEKQRKTVLDIEIIVSTIQNAGLSLYHNLDFCPETWNEMQLGRQESHSSTLIDPKIIFLCLLLGLRMDTLDLELGDF